MLGLPQSRPQDSEFAETDLEMSNWAFLLLQVTHSELDLETSFVAGRRSDSNEFLVLGHRNNLDFLPNSTICQVCTRFRALRQLIEEPSVS
jgi:hypothetical protein